MGTEEALAGCTNVPTTQRFTESRDTRYHLSVVPELEVRLTLHRTETGVPSVIVPSRW